MADPQLPPSAGGPALAPSSAVIQYPNWIDAPYHLLTSSWAGGNRVVNSADGRVSLIGANPRRWCISFSCTGPNSPDWMNLFPDTGGGPVFTLDRHGGMLTFSIFTHGPWVTRAWQGEVFDSLRISWVESFLF